jgi:hypothetical protein
MLLMEWREPTPGVCPIAFVTSITIVDGDRSKDALCAVGNVARLVFSRRRLPLARGKVGNMDPLMISPNFLKNPHLSIRAVTSSDELEVFRALPSERKTCGAIVS